jgi:hypothetical protein
LLGLLGAAFLLAGGQVGGPSNAGAATLPTWAEDAILNMDLGPSTGQSRYVSPNGSDKNSGSKQHPWRTVQRGLNALRPGWTLYVRGGTYRRDLIMRRAGNAGAPITVRNYPGEHVVIRGSGGYKQPLTVTSGASYVKFRGLAFVGARGYRTTNIYVAGSADHIQFDKCVSRDSSGQGFFSDGGTRSIRITGCYFYDNGSGEQAHQGHNIYLEGSGHVVANNIIVGAKRGFGIQIYPKSNRAVIASNTIVGNRYDGIIIGSDGSTTANNAVIVDNILAFNRRYALSTYWGGKKGSGNIVAHNLTWKNASGGLKGSGITFLGNVRGAPDFANRSSGNYRLGPASSAVDRALTSLSPRVDFDDVSRPQGAVADIGAFERPQ